MLKIFKTRWQVILMRAGLRAAHQKVVGSSPTNSETSAITLETLTSFNFRLFNRNDLAIGYCKSLWESFKSLFSTLHKCILFSLCHRLTIIGVHIVACVLNILYIQRCKSVYACLLKWSFMWSKEVAMATQGQCLGSVCVCVCVWDWLLGVQQSIVAGAQ